MRLRSFYSPETFRVFAQYIAVGLAVIPGFILGVALNSWGFVGEKGVFVVGFLIGIVPAVFAWIKTGATLREWPELAASATRTDSSRNHAEYFNLVYDNRYRPLVNIVVEIGKCQHEEVSKLHLGTINIDTSIVAQLADVKRLEMEAYRTINVPGRTSASPMILSKHVAAGISTEGLTHGSRWSDMEDLLSAKSQIVQVQ